MQVRSLYLLIMAIITFCLNPSFTYASAQPQWLNYAAISPDGRWIAFGYQGNLWKVPAQGGAAIQLNNHTFYSGYPVWSHDSKHIAFAANQYGNFDVFLMKAEGGEARRLTHHSSSDIPSDFSADNSKVLFGSVRQGLQTSLRFPAGHSYTSLYEVSVKGGRNILISTSGMTQVRLHKNGDQLLFQDQKGRENPDRKYDTSSVTRDIWTYHLKKGTYKKISSYKGHDLQPVWGDRNEVYYLSERNGSLNVFKGDVQDSSRLQQLTYFKDNPVRNLSRSENGTLAFTYNGSIYTISKGSTPKIVAVDYPKPKQKLAFVDKEVKAAITDMAVSADGKQIAFISRGELFVSSADGKITTQLISSPGQERMPNFSPDGRKLLYSVENGNSWDIEQLSISDAAKHYFYEKPEIRKEAILASEQDEFQGVYSPDGTHIAYVENRDVIKSYNLGSKKTALLLPEGLNYSGSDGDQYFVWSPDSQSLLVHSKQGATGYDQEVLLLKNDGTGKFTNLTKSGFKDDYPQWSKNGRVIYWISDKEAYRNFTEDSFKDIYAIDLDKNPGLTKEGASEQKRLTDFSTDINGGVVAANADKLYYFSKTEGNYDLFELDLKTLKRKLTAKLDLSNPVMKIANDGLSVFILDQGNIIHVRPDEGTVNRLDLNVSFRVDLAAERVYIFEHIYHLVRKRFMYPDLIASAIEKNYENYRQFIPNLGNDLDFANIINEFLGELNTSHTGVRYRSPMKDADETAALGLFFNESSREKGLQVKEVIAGGPFDVHGSQMRAEMIIDKIGGQIVKSDLDWTSLLNRQTGKKLTISFHDPREGKAYEETVVPVSAFDETEYLLYNRWVRRLERLTDSLSGGRIGYVHVRVMNDGGMRTLYDKALGQYRNAESLIVDTRGNRGGSLHDELTTFLSGKVYLTENRQGRVTPAGEPFKKWTKPTAMIIAEDNYSDAFLSPYTYKLLGIGKLIGMPVPGSGTASQVERQINQNLGIQFATAATYFVGLPHANENFQLEPDIKVRNEYDQLLKYGNDQQLKAAVEELLRSLGNKKE